MNKKITTTVIDNWLEPQLANFLSDYLHKGIVYNVGHRSNQETILLFYSELFR
jgi:hypothetical protein